MNKFLLIAAAISSFLLAEPAQAQRAGTLISATPVAGAPANTQAWSIHYWSTAENGSLQDVTGMVVAPAGGAAAGTAAGARLDPRDVGRGAAMRAVAVAELLRFDARHGARPFSPRPRRSMRSARAMWWWRPIIPGSAAMGCTPIWAGFRRRDRRWMRSGRRGASRAAGAGRRFALWGASQGGHAALWTAQLAPRLCARARAGGRGRRGAADRPDRQSSRRGRPVDPRLSDGVHRL